jgi:hypothetical protein
MCSCYIVVQWDVETALFNYCADTGPLDLDHLEADYKRELIVKLRHDADTASYCYARHALRIKTLSFLSVKSCLRDQSARSDRA